MRKIGESNFICTLWKLWNFTATGSFFAKIPSNQSFTNNLRTVHKLIWRKCMTVNFSFFPPLLRKFFFVKSIYSKLLLIWFDGKFATKNSVISTVCSWKTKNLLSPENISSNQLFSTLSCQTFTFTKIFAKNAWEWISIISTMQCKQISFNFHIHITIW